MKIIDLNEARSSREAKVFSGRERGRHWRRQFELDRLDKEAECVVVKIPRDVFSVNMSFFLGLFGESVRSLGSDAFREKYKFECDPVLVPSILQGVDRALKDSSALATPA